MTAKRDPFYPGTITLDTLPDLLSFHRTTFGGYRMEDEPAGGEPAAGDKGGEGKPTEFQPITSQEDLDRALGARLAREREKFSDYADLKKKAAEHDKAVEAARTEHEKAVEAARAEGKTEALTQANTRLVSAEARALAAEAKFASPALAVRALELGDVKVSEDGSVDADAIRSKLKELADSGAFVINDGSGAKPAPRADKSQGASGGSTKPGDAGRLAAQHMGFVKQPAAS